VLVAVGVIAVGETIAIVVDGSVVVVDIDVPAVLSTRVDRGALPVADDTVISSKCLTEAREEGVY
jgi:hypothetical protein